MCPCLLLISRQPPHRRIALLKQESHFCSVVGISRVSYRPTPPSPPHASCFGASLISPSLLPRRPRVISNLVVYFSPASQTQQWQTVKPLNVTESISWPRGNAYCKAASIARSLDPVLIGTHLLCTFHVNTQTDYQLAVGLY